MKHDTLFEFLRESKNAYCTVNLLKKKLLSLGFSELCENEEWSLKQGGKYFVVRSDSSLIAFCNSGFGFSIVASHSDQPAFKLKAIERAGNYSRILTERYGGMIYHTWLDRPLEISGRVMINTDCGIEARVVTLLENAVIPSVAIHLDRTQNESLKLNPAQDLLPLIGLKSDLTAESLIASRLGIEESAILSHDLFISSAEEPRLFGENNSLVLSPRLDDIACVCASFEAFTDERGDTDMCPVLAVFDNEEVGSETKQGAASDFLREVLLRISGNEMEYIRRTASGFMISADNAHALHPNHPELSDKTAAPILGGGVAVKHNANQRYTTDAHSEAVLLTIAKKAGITLGHYYNRADIPGGSTLGSISNTKVSVPTVDIGLPQLAMHSLCETMALDDYFSMKELLKAFYSSSLRIKNGITIVE